jgi:hypothetical protein
MKERTIRKRLSYTDLTSPSTVPRVSNKRERNDSLMVLSDAMDGLEAQQRLRADEELVDSHFNAMQRKKAIQRLLNGDQSRDPELEEVRIRLTPDCKLLLAHSEMQRLHCEELKKIIKNRGVEIDACHACGFPIDVQTEIDNVCEVCQAKLPCRGHCEGTACGSIASQRDGIPCAKECPAHLIVCSFCQLGVCSAHATTCAECDYLIGCPECSSSVLECAYCNCTTLCGSCYGEDHADHDRAYRADTGGEMIVIE